MNRVPPDDIRWRHASPWTELVNRLRPPGRNLDGTITVATSVLYAPLYGTPKVCAQFLNVGVKQNYSGGIVIN